MDKVIRTLVSCLLLGLAGCASNSHVVRCDGRLEPINTPASRAVQAADPAEVNKAEMTRSDRE